MSIDFKSIEKWFSGKGLTVLRDYVAPTLAEAEREGYWPKGASRKVYAALNKQNVAAKFAKANERNWNLREKNPSGLLVDIQDQRDQGHGSTLQGWTLNHAMMFGQVLMAPEALKLADALVPYCANDVERAALTTARQWAVDFTPVAELLALLDMSKPKPTVRVLKTLSQTVAYNVGQAMGIKLDTITVPEIELVWVVKTVLVKGKPQKMRVPEGRVIWPEGTQHYLSRHAHKDSNCHACGHLIMNVFNWVPLVAETATGPASLWVGRDCAKNLFGCEVEGEAEYSEREGK